MRHFHRLDNTLVKISFFSLLQDNESNWAPISELERRQNEPRRWWLWTMRMWPQGSCHSILPSSTVRQNFKWGTQVSHGIVKRIVLMLLQRFLAPRRHELHLYLVGLLLSPSNSSVTYSSWHTVTLTVACLYCAHFLLHNHCIRLDMGLSQHRPTPGPIAATFWGRNIPWAWCGLLNKTLY